MIRDNTNNSRLLNIIFFVDSSLIFTNELIHTNIVKLKDPLNNYNILFSK